MSVDSFVAGGLGAVSVFVGVMTFLAGIAWLADDPRRKWWVWWVLSALLTTGGCLVIWKG